jgi:hypothetical protein
MEKNKMILFERADISLIDVSRKRAFDYKQIMNARGLQPSNDYNLDMRSLLPRLFDAPTHGQRVLLAYAGSNRYFACYEYDVVVGRWRMEAVGYEPPLPSMDDAFRALSSRVTANCEKIEELREQNSKDIAELQRLRKAMPTSHAVKTQYQLPEIDGRNHLKPAPVD